MQKLFSERTQKRTPHQKQNQILHQSAQKDAQRQITLAAAAQKGKNVVQFRFSVNKIST